MMTWSAWPQIILLSLMLFEMLCKMLLAYVEKPVFQNGYAAILEAIAFFFLLWQGGFFHALGWQ